MLALEALAASGGACLSQNGGAWWVHALYSACRCCASHAAHFRAPARRRTLQVGDGTTSVIILAGEMLAAAEPSLERNLHPTTIIRCGRGRLAICVHEEALLLSAWICTRDNAIGDATSACRFWCTAAAHPPRLHLARCGAGC